MKTYKDKLDKKQYMKLSCEIDFNKGHKINARICFGCGELCGPAHQCACPACGVAHDLKEVCAPLDLLADKAKHINTRGPAFEALWLVDFEAESKRFL